MQNKRKRRAIIGTTCLVVVALAMGWFVGQYIPGTPKAPETPVYADMYSGSGISAQETVDTDFGKEATLEGIIQGRSFGWDRTNPDIYPQGGDNETLIEHIKENGTWEYEYPDLALSIVEARTVSATSFTDLYPNFSAKEPGTSGFSNQVPGNLYLEDSTFILVSVSVTNRSDTLISGYPSLYEKGALPALKLWTNWTETYADSVSTEDNQILVKAGFLSDGTLGSGATINFQAFAALNESVRMEREDPNDSQSAYIYLEPGETEIYIFPYLVPDKAIGGDVKHLDLSNFCIQTPDYATETSYRLWLA